MGLCQVGHNDTYPTILAEGPANLAVKVSRRSCLAFEKPDRALAVIYVAIVIAVGEARPDFSQIARSDRLLAHHA